MGRHLMFILAGLAFGTQANASIDLYWRTQADFQAGSCNGVDPNFQPGSLVLSPAGGLPQDAFLTASPSAQWHLLNASYGLESLGRLRLLGQGAGPFRGLALQTDNGSQDFALKLTATCGIAEMSSIGVGFVSAGGQVRIQVRVIRTNGVLKASMLSSNGSNSLEIGAQVLADNRVELGLSKYANLVTGTMRYPVGQGNWSVLGSVTISAGTYSILLGTLTSVEGSEPSLSYPSLNGTLSDLATRPFITQGVWSSPILDLGCIPSSQGQLSWEQFLPSGTAIEIRTASSSDGLNWDAWSAPVGNATFSKIQSTAKRFLRLQVTLKTDATAQYSPRIGSMAVHYPDMVKPNIEIYSDTHPAGKWSDLSAARFVWRLPPVPSNLSGNYTWDLSVLGQVASSGGGPIKFVASPSVQSLAYNLPGDGQYRLRLKAQSNPAPNGGILFYATPTPVPMILENSYDFFYDGTPPSAVSISSTTHAPLLATRSASPRFNLSAGDAASGVSGYAAVIDQMQFSDPGALVNAGSELSWEKLSSGTWYLHARAVDRAGNFGPVSHYGLIVALGGPLLDAGDVQVYPNPLRSGDGRFKYSLAESAADVLLEWRDAQGRLLMSRPGECGMGPHLVAWDPGSWANGVYLIRVKARGQDGKSWDTFKKVALLR